MGHYIQAVILRGAFDAGKAAMFDLTPIRLTDELTLFPFSDDYVTYWGEKLDEEDLLTKGMPGNPCVIHRMVNSITDEPLFALIETAYHGGIGSQGAAVYRGAELVMHPEETRLNCPRWGGPEIFAGPIDQALSLLGVAKSEGLDEFDTVGLGQYRNFEDLLWKYYEYFEEDGPDPINQQDNPDNQAGP